MPFLTLNNFRRGEYAKNEHASVTVLTKGSSSMCSI